MKQHMQGMVRYQAQWVVKQVVDTDGEGNPDNDTYGTSLHLTREDAERAAIENARRCDQCDWILVAEQKYRGYDWEDVRRWTGDWTGLCEETLSIEASAE